MPAIVLCSSHHPRLPTRGPYLTTSTALVAPKLRYLLNQIELVTQTSETNYRSMVRNDYGYGHHRMLDLMIPKTTIYRAPIAMNAMNWSGEKGTGHSKI